MLSPQTESSPMEHDKAAVVSGQPQVILNNQLQIENQGLEMLDKSLEILLPCCHRVGNSVGKFENLVLAWVACGWKCPVKSCA